MGASRCSSPNPRRLQQEDLLVCLLATWDPLYREDLHVHCCQLQGWLSFSAKRQDRLLTEARALSAGILPPGEAIARAGELPDRVRQVDGKDRWKSWRWLIATHNATGLRQPPSPTRCKCYTLPPSVKEQSFDTAKGGD